MELGSSEKQFKYTGLSLGNIFLLLRALDVPQNREIFEQVFKQRTNKK